MPFAHAINLDWKRTPIEGTEPPSERKRQRIEDLAAEIATLGEDAGIPRIFDLTEDLAEAIDQDGADAAFILFETRLPSAIEPLVLESLRRALEAHGVIQLDPIDTGNGIGWEENPISQEFIRIIREPDPRKRLDLWIGRWTAACLIDREAKEAGNDRGPDENEAGPVASDILDDVKVARILLGEEPELFKELERSARPFSRVKKPWTRKLHGALA